MSSNSNGNITPASLRQRAGLTQRAVSISMNKRTQTISDWERGTRTPQLTFSEVKQLIDLYKCTLEELCIAFEQGSNTGTSKSRS
jgi:transcriptional regulator with XRE-family HTH domain